MNSIQLDKDHFMSPDGRVGTKVTVESLMKKAKPYIKDKPKKFNITLDPTEFNPDFVYYIFCIKKIIDPINKFIKDRFPDYIGVNIDPINYENLSLLFDSKANGPGIIIDKNEVKASEELISFIKENFPGYFVYKVENKKVIKMENTSINFYRESNDPYFKLVKARSIQDADYIKLEGNLPIIDIIRKTFKLSKDDNIDFINPITIRVTKANISKPYNEFTLLNDKPCFEVLDTSLYGTNTMKRLRQ